MVGMGLISCSKPVPLIHVPPPSYHFQEIDRSGSSDSQQHNLSTTPSSTTQRDEKTLQEGPGSLQQLKALAQEHNPTLRQAWAHVDAEQAKSLQAGLYPNPIGGYRGGQIGVKDTIGEFQGGFVQQEIITAGKLDLSREKYLARASASEYQALVQEYRVMNAIDIQFYRLLGFQERVDIQRELLESWKDHVLTMQEMFNVGQANEADLRRATIQCQRQQLTLQMRENELQLERERLITLVGIAFPVERLSGSLYEDLPLLDFERALQRVLTESPELGLARANVRADQITVQREKVEPIPNITVQGSAGRNYVETQTVYGVQAFIEIPIFDRNQGTIQQAQADLRRQVAQVRLTELRLRRSLAEHFQRYLTALQHVQIYRNSILLEAEERYKIQLQSYEADRETWPAVLAAQQDLFKLRLEYIDQLMAWRMARVAVEGLLLIDGLQSPKDVTPPGHIDANPKPR